MAYDEIWDKKISFIGEGVITEAFITRLLETKGVRPDAIMATDVQPERLQDLERKFHIRISGDNKAGADFGNIIVLAVPGGVVKAVLSESCRSVNEEQVIVSLAAALPAWLIESTLCKPVPVVRVIPNTPSMIGSGVNPYCVGSHTTEVSLALVKEFLDMFGHPLLIDEKLMNAFTALTAIGPTYFFPVIKALREASVKLGISEVEAEVAVAQTMIGAAELVLKTGRHPEDLNLMISTRTIDESAVDNLFTQALMDAFARINRSEAKLTQ
jgi:pyrroline-5-carboxylate reductase